VVGVVAADHLAPSGLAEGDEVLNGYLPGRFQGFATSGGEEHPIEVAGGQSGQCGPESDSGLVPKTPQWEATQLAHRSFGGHRKFTSTVSDIHREKAGQTVEIMLAVGVENGGLHRARSPAGHGVGLPTSSRSAPEVALSERVEGLGCGAGHANLPETGREASTPKVVVSWLWSGSW